MLQSTGSQRVGHNLATEQEQRARSQEEPGSWWQYGTSVLSPGFWLHENHAFPLWIETLRCVPGHCMQFLSEASSAQRR